MAFSIKQWWNLRTGKSLKKNYDSQILLDVSSSNYTKTEIVHDWLICSLLVWVESPATCSLMEVEKIADRGDNDIQLDSIEAKLISF